MENEGIEIPPESLSPEALLGLIDAFILTEGTDYGESETSHETKVEQVRRQLLNGEAKIRFDPESETCAIFPRDTPMRGSRGKNLDEISEIDVP